MERAQAFAIGEPLHHVAAEIVSPAAVGLGTSNRFLISKTFSFSFQALLMFEAQHDDKIHQNCVYYI